MRRAPVRPCGHGTDEDMDVATKAYMKSVILIHFTFSVKRGLDTDVPLNRKAVGGKKCGIFMSLLLPRRRGGKRVPKKNIVHKGW